MIFETKYGVKSTKNYGLHIACYFKAIDVG